jgi:hypothetical protein
MSEPKPATPVGGGNYVVRPGETMTSIAFDHGFFWETIWNHGANAALKEERKHPHVLLPGDRVTIPELRKRTLALPTTKLHRFRLKGIPARIRLVLRDVENRPMPGKKYKLEAGDQVFQGTTGGDGSIEHFVAPGVKSGELTVWPKMPLYPEEFHMTLRIGYLEPVESVKGMQARLINLGFPCGSEYGEIGKDTRSALAAFQRANGLPVSGEPDRETQDKLLELYPE